MYSKDLKMLIDQMLSVNPKNRPTIATILEKPFIKKKVAAYIYDFVQTYKNEQNLEFEECQVDILKDQAEKLGIFNSMVKDINDFEGEYDKLQGGNSNKYINYLKKKKEEKRKLEDKINELEQQKKQIYSNLKQKVQGKHVDKGKFSKNKPISRFDMAGKKKNLNNDSDHNDNSKLKLKRPESAIKKSTRKYSDGNNKDHNKSDSLDHSEVKKANQRNISDQKIKLSRPTSGFARDNNLKAIVDDSLEEVLETIREEKTDTDLIVEKNRVIELTQEITKMRDYLEKTQNKIEKIEKIIEKDGYDNEYGSDISDEDKGNAYSRRVDDIYTKEDDGTQKLVEQIKILRK
jgi:serine/threonine protein kinase